MLATIANHLWQSTLFIFIAALLAFSLRKNGAHIRYWLWMAASLKFFVPFSVLVAFGSQFSWQAEPTVGGGFAVPADWANLAGNVVQPVEPYVGTPAIEANIATFSSIWSVEFLVLLVWAIGFVGVAGFWLVRWLKVKALVSRAQQLTHDVAPEFRAFPVPIKSTPAAIEPGIVGISHPVLLLPQGLLERLTHRQLQAILAHERCHLQRRDNLTAAIHMLVEAIFWFHPLVWWIGARLVEERERACDAAVLRAGNDPETYAEGILDVCQHYVAAPLDCVAGVSGADLKKRVRSIMTFQGETRLHFMKMALLASVSLIVVASPILVGALTASRADAQATAPIGGIDGEWPAIESVSISPSLAENSPARSLLINPDGTFTTRNWSLRGIIAFAYNIQDSEIVELSAAHSDLASSRYNITAKVAKSNPDTPVSTREHLLAARRLLAEHFNLQFHVETQSVPVYALLVAPGGAKLKTAQAGDPGPLQGRGYNSITGSAAPMILLKQFLANELKRPILDQTGLEDRYNYTLKWGPEPVDPSESSTTVAEPKDPTREKLLEALEQQLGLMLVSQDGDVQRLVVDRLQQPVALMPPPVEVAMDAATFEKYIGHYDFPPARVMTIYRDGERFFAQLTGQPPIQIHASSERDFFTKEADSKGRFVIGSDGAATAVVLHQNGREMQAQRIDTAVANERAAQLANRIRDKIAQRGTADGLRKHLDGLSIDRPVYDLMTEEVANAVREGWRATKDRYPQLGQLKAIDFTGVAPVGADIYLATYENGKSEWRVHVNEAGKMDILNYRRLVSP